MNKSALTYVYLTECFDHDREAGVLRWKSRPREHFVSKRACSIWNAQYPGRLAGCLQNTGRLAVKISGTSYLIHRLIWAVLNGLDMDDVPDQIDHEDMVPTNNVETNLRAATHSQNQHNRRAYSNNTSGFKGVSFHKPSGKWVAQIGLGGKRTSLGLYATPEEAHVAYASAANDNYGQFARAA